MNLKLINHQSPGDALVLTACVESLKIQYPNYDISVETTAQEIWENNPNVGNYKPHKIIEMQYPNIHKSDMIRTGHFMKAFCDYLGRELGISLSLEVNKPFLYLTEKEKNTRTIKEPYIVINAGVKQDFTCKKWGGYQEVTNILSKRFKIVQIGEKHHLHKPLDNAINMIGKTNNRELFTLCYHSICGIGTTTYLQHIFAAFEKPFICILGAREPLSWVWYNTQSILSTQGQISCANPNACWKSRVEKLNDGEEHDNSLCVNPVKDNGEMIPKCMKMISVSAVLESFERYVEGGIIPIDRRFKLL